MQFAPNLTAHSEQEMQALAPAELIKLVSKQGCEIVNLRRQVAWFQRQIFGQKSEQRLPEPDGVQGTLGESFDAVPDVAPPNPKTRVASHERASKPKRPTDSADESSLFFDDQKVPVEVINVPQSGRRGLGRIRGRQREDQLPPGTASRQLRHPQICTAGKWLAYGVALG